MMVWKFFGGLTLEMIAAVCFFLVIAAGISTVCTSGFAQSSQITPDSLERTPITFLVSILSDKSCMFKIDGGVPHRAEPGVPVILRTKDGDHFVTAVTTDGKDHWEGRVNVNHEGAALII